MTSILKTLENKRLIKSCRSYRHKNRKMYILASLGACARAGRQRRIR